MFCEDILIYSSLFLLFEFMEILTHFITIEDIEEIEVVQKLLIFLDNDIARACCILFLTIPLLAL